MMICIDAGHGGPDPGCSNGQYLEKDFTLILAKLLESKLHEKAPSIEVILTRDSDNYISLQDRVNIANSNECQLFVSIHINAGSTTATGIETLVYLTSGDTGRLALNVHKALINATGAVDRGVKTRTDLYVLKNTKMPAILIECGFIVADLAKLLNKEYQNKIVNGIIAGLCQTLGVNIMNDKNSIEILHEKGIINDVEYWKNAVKCVNYLQELLDNMADFVIKL